MISALKKGRRFTLIELLIVAALVVVVISLLLPSLRRALEQTKSIQCSNKVRRIAIAYFTYAEDHNDYLPDGRPPVALPSFHSWVKYWLLEYATGKPLDYYSLPPVGRAEVFYCPSTKDPFKDKRYFMRYHGASYSDNRAIHYRVGGPGGAPITSQTWLNIMAPFEIFQLNDVNLPESTLLVSDSIDRAKGQSESIWKGMLVRRHLEGGNIALFSGAVKWIDFTEYASEALFDKNK